MKPLIINETEIKPKAFMHRTHDGCVTAATHGEFSETTYKNPRVLVDWEDVVDHVDWLEHGIVEWRDLALQLKDKLKEIEELCKLQNDALRICTPTKGDIGYNLFHSALKAYEVTHARL